MALDGGEITGRKFFALGIIEYDDLITGRWRRRVRRARDDIETLAFDNFFQITAGAGLAVDDQNFGFGAYRNPGQGVIVGRIAIRFGVAGC